MSRMNFPLPFLAWIHTCISTVKVSLSINGECFGYFKTEKGIRQGDPISSSIFVIVMEVLTQLLCRENINKNIDYHPKCKIHKISSLMFADDLLLFSKPNIKSISNIFATLDIFKTMTGLQINKNKSHISIAGVTDSLITNILHLSGL